MLARALRSAEHAAARLIRAAGRSRPAEIVFLGDSITQFWSDEDPWLFRPGRINAGLSGDTTATMRARFDRDVLVRRPRAVHIMGGTNDLWYGDPGAAGAATIANIRWMAEAGRSHGIAVILAPPPPITRAAEPLFAHPELFEPLRGAVAEIARAGGHVLVDYAASLADADGQPRPGMTTDGVHLTRAGYRAIREQAATAIAAAPTPRGGIRPV